MIIEMLCIPCDVPFIVTDLPDAVEVIEHYEKADGTPCGSTQTKLNAVYTATSSPIPRLVQAFDLDTDMLDELEPAVIRGYN